MFSYSCSLLLEIFSMLTLNYLSYSCDEYYIHPRLMLGAYFIFIENNHKFSCSFEIYGMWKRFSTPSFFDKSQIFLKIFRNLLCQSFHLKSRTQAWTFNCTLINLSQESCFSDDFILDTASASTENSQIAFKYYVAVEEIIIFTLFDDNFRLLCNLCLLSAGKRK